VRKGARDDARELALELGDLLAQGAARGALVDRLEGGCAPVNGQLLGLAHASDSSS
jgi:hypothetical protein